MSGILEVLYYASGNLHYIKRKGKTFKKPCAKTRHDPKKNHDKKLQIHADLQKSVTIQRKNVTALHLVTFADNYPVKYTPGIR